MQYRSFAAMDAAHVPRGAQGVGLKNGTRVYIPFSEAMKGSEFPYLKDGSLHPGLRGILRSAACPPYAKGTRRGEIDSEAKTIPAYNLPIAYVRMVVTNHLGKRGIDPETVEAMCDYRRDGAPHLIEDVVLTPNGCLPAHELDVVIAEIQAEIQAQRPLNQN